MPAPEQSPSTPITDFDNQTLFLRPARGEILKLAVLGALIGLLIPFVGYLLEHFFIAPVFCTAGDALGLCTNAGSVGYYTASVIFGAISIVVLANWQVFRPLVIAVAAIAALWGFKRYVQDIVGSSGLEYYLFSVVLYAAAYLLFYWIMRIRRFALSLILTIAIVLLLRWALVA